MICKVSSIFGFCLFTPSGIFGNTSAYNFTDRRINLFSNSPLPFIFLYFVAHFSFCVDVALYLDWVYEFLSQVFYRWCFIIKVSYLEHKILFCHLLGMLNLIIWSWCCLISFGAVYPPSAVALWVLGPPRHMLPSGQTHYSQGCVLMSHRGSCKLLVSCWSECLHWLYVPIWHSWNQKKWIWPC